MQFQRAKFLLQRSIMIIEKHIKMKPELQRSDI
jgi:hypothetical protein